jgi:LPXTG-motif cell wall-anchored protein
MGTMLFTVPAALRNENDTNHQLDNSHGNRYYQNRMGFGPAGTPNGTVHPNGLDFWWDESGVLDCWQENTAAPGHQIYSDPPYNTESLGPPPSIGGRPSGGAIGHQLPTCSPLTQPGPNTPPQGLKGGLEAPCSQYDLHANPDPTGCSWDHAPTPPPDRVSTGFGVNAGQQFLPADKAPCQPGGEACWSLGWVNPPDGAAAQQPGPVPNNLPIIGSLPNTEAQLPLLLIIGLALFAAGLRVGRARRRRTASPEGAGD